MVRLNVLQLLKNISNALYYAIVGVSPFEILIFLLYCVFVLLLYNN